MERYAMSDIPHLFAYRSDNTLIHRAPAEFKLVCMIAVTVCAFSNSLTTLIIISIIIALLIPVSKMKPLTVLRNVKIVFWYAMFIFVFRITGKPVETGIIMQELHDTGIYSWQLAAVLFTGTLFYETTTILDIRHTISSIQNVCIRLTRNKIPIPDIAFLLSLTITFIPRIFETW